MPKSNRELFMDDMFLERDAFKSPARNRKRVPKLETPRDSHWHRWESMFFVHFHNYSKNIDIVARAI